MISFTVRMRFDEKDRAAVEEILRQLGPASRQEPGCANYVAHFVEGEPATVLIYEQYRDEAALEHHRNSPHFKQYASGGLYQLMKERAVEGLHAVE
ncbi:MAG TPA: putative quinol monooxygenase [Acidobacteriaceae bacterium]|nr:putative quinol monooxygenase [Acidobacteriaceae bacterium]